MSRFQTGCLLFAIMVVGPYLGSQSLAQDTYLEIERQAIRRAVKQVEPSVVQIETIGGIDRVEGSDINQGPATGVIVSDDGFVVTSLINFVHQPTNVVVRLSNGKMLPAVIHAKDTSRGLAVLKVETTEALTPVELVSKNELAVGQTVIAVGKIYDAQSANISVGILSALNRIWGKAIQTDAKVSLSNYGGPLIDLRGRMIGVLAPLSPNDSSVSAGSEWYDSGIGFAVPVGGLLNRLDRTQSGQEFQSGMLGISYSGTNIYADPAKVGVVYPGSPAQQAGILRTDEIVKVGDQPIRRQSELKHAIGHLYAGDVVQLTVLRKGQELNLDVKLVGEFPPFDRPVIGCLFFSEPGKPKIRWVTPDSELAKAGVKTGDVVEAIDGNDVNNLLELRGHIDTVVVGNEVLLKIRSEGGLSEVKVRTSNATADLIADLSLANPADAVESVDVSVSEFPNQCFAVYPKNPQTPPSLLVWVPKPGNVSKDKFVESWTEWCLKYNVAILVPQSKDNSKWDPGESEFIVKSMALLKGLTQIDVHRVAIGGEDVGGLMAASTCFVARSQFRGLVLLDSHLPSRIEDPQTSAESPLMVFVGMSSETNKKMAIGRSVEMLRKAKFPLYSESNGPRGMSGWADKVFRWVDSVDRY